MTGYKTTKPLRSIELPAKLYHGSVFLTEELRPGFYRTGCARSWGAAGSRHRGGEETNHYLYATSDARAATDYAALRAIELAPWGLLQSYQGESAWVLAFREPVALEELAQLQTYVYELQPQPQDCWIRNQELPEELRAGQFRSRRTIRPIGQQRVHVATWLHNRRVVISTPHRKVA